MKKNQAKHQVVRGMQNPNTKTFWPYPLDIGSLGDQETDITLTLRKDDPAAWSNPEGTTPLVVEFKVAYFLSGKSGHLGYLLHRRAADLGVDVEELPAAATLRSSDEEEQFFEDAVDAAYNLARLATFRWANFEEVADPDGLEVTTRVPAEKESYAREHDGLTPVETAIYDQSLRAAARKGLCGDDLKAFDRYCERWDQRRGLLARMCEEEYRITEA
jgi:hypothetical protein